MNFEKDLREQIIQLLKEDKVKFNKQDSTSRLLISYLNVLNRRIPVKKRKVFMSDNIKKIIDGNKLHKKYIEALLKFKSNFENGIDMNGHLSANIYYSDLSVKNREKSFYRKSRDYLLDDWGIYHLHLRDKDAKNEKEMHSNKNGKEKGNRSEYLLFVKITSTDIYFIDILNHNEKSVFAKQELLETLDRNWHFLLKKYMLPDVISVSDKFTDKEIHQARQSGSLIVYQINDKAYVCIGGGLTTAGTNIMHTRRADNILEDMYFIEEYFRNNYTSIKNEVADIAGIKCFNKDLEFKFVLDVKGYVVKEVNTNYAALYFYEEDYLKRRVGIIKDKY
ncbi:hypothetical protein CF069_13315 [Clostridium botulinum]